MKEELAKKPILQIYNPAYKTELCTDASKYGYGAVLSQELPEDGKMHSVYYMSKKTISAESKCSSYDLEVLAVVVALKKFRIYLLGIQFEIITDCSAFQQTMNKKDIVLRIIRWALMLEEFYYYLTILSSIMLEVECVI